MTKSIFLLLVAICVFASGCTVQTINRKNIICLIDYSGTIKPETLDIYARTLSNDVFMNFDVADKMVLIPIDEGSKIKAAQLLYYDLSKEKFDKKIKSVTRRQDEINQRLTQYKTQHQETIHKTVIQEKENRKEFTNLTDIIAALEQVPSNMEHLQPPSTLEHIWHGLSGESEMTSENVIIIFSDMIHESNELNFLRTNLDEKTIDKIISELKAKNKIPDLKGSKVFVCGRTAKTNTMIDNNQNFWKKYFKEANADLVAYDFDSSKAISNFLRTRN